MTVEGIDYAFSNPSPAGLYAAGKRFAMRYVGPGSVSKHLTATERDALWDAGLAVVLLAEAAADSALGGNTTGILHGRSAEIGATTLGAPPDRPIYFAVDFDVSAIQWPTVANYLRGVAFAIGPARVGIYGGYDAITWAVRDQVATWFFQTYAWSGGRWHPANHVEQYHNGASVAGGTVDLCRARKPVYGQWNKGDDMTGPLLVRVKETGAIYATAGTTYWHLTETTYPVALAAYGKKTFDYEIQAEADMAAFGVDVITLQAKESTPPGTIGNTFNISLTGTAVPE